MLKKVLPLLFAFTYSLAISQDATDTTEVEERIMLSIHTAEVEAQGFSNDGKYFIFTQVIPGEYNGASGYVYVIDVAKNNWAHKPAFLEPEVPDWSADEIRDSLKYKRDSVLSKYGVKRGNIGKAFDLSKKNTVVVKNVTYTVDLKTDGNLIDLHLKGNGKDIVLQKDTKVPASRGPVTAYRLFKAYSLGDEIVVFIEYDGPEREGFENARYYDRKYIAVTGVVK